LKTKTKFGFGFKMEIQNIKEKKENKEEKNPWPSPHAAGPTGWALLGPTPHLAQLSYSLAPWSTA
jgi:hypothetical protein